MKHLLVATGVFLLPAAIHAQEPKVQCPGENTMEMRYCAGLSWEQSTDQLKSQDVQGTFPAVAGDDPSGLCSRLCRLQGRQHLPAVGGGVR